MKSKIRIISALCFLFSFNEYDMVIAMDRPLSEQEKLLFVAAKNDDAESIKRIMLSGVVDINVRDESGKTALSWAANNKNKALRELLHYSPNVNLANKHGWTPLKKAASSGDGHGVCFLLEAGANIDQADDEGYTPLMNAYNMPQIAQVLITGNANVNHQAFKDGTTALMWAVIDHNISTIKMLIAAGAHDNLRRKADGKSARLIAAKHDRLDILELLEQKFGSLAVPLIGVTTREILESSSDSLLIQVTI